MSVLIRELRFGLVKISMLACSLGSFFVAATITVAQSPITAQESPIAGQQAEDEDDEYGEEGYGSDYSSSPTRRTTSGSARDAMAQSYGSAMSSLLGTVNLKPLLAPASDFVQVDPGPVLRTGAEHAYRNGNYPLGMQLFYGYLVTEYEQARVDLQTVKYSKLLRRPVWQVRWGVSFAVRGDTDVVDPQPIEEGKTTVNRGRGGPQISISESSPESEIGDSFRGRRTTQAIRQPQRDMLDTEAQEELSNNLGLVATMVAEEFGTRYRQGDFGNALVDVTPPQPVDPQPRRGAEPETVSEFAPMSQEMVDALDDSPEPLSLWQPGIQFLGEGDAAGVAKIAKGYNLDVVLHFDIYLKTGRNEYVQNVSRCRIIQVSTGKSLGISKGIDSFEAIAFAKTGRGSEREYVKTQLDNLFSIVDRYVKTADLPALTPEVAKRRIGMLISGPRENRLRTLAEIRLYQTQELITAEEAEAAFDIIGGEDALLLIHGTLEDRLAMVRQWAIQAVPESAN